MESLASTMSDVVVVGTRSLLEADAAKTGAEKKKADEKKDIDP